MNHFALSGSSGGPYCPQFKGSKIFLKILDLFGFYLLPVSYNILIFRTHLFSGCKNTTAASFRLSILCIHERLNLRQWAGCVQRPKTK